MLGQILVAVTAVAVAVAAMDAGYWPVELTASQYALSIQPKLKCVYD